MEEENIWRRKTFVGGKICRRKDLIGGGKHLEEENIWRRKTFGGGKHLEEENIWRRKDLIGHPSIGGWMGKH